MTAPTKNVVDLPAASVLAGTDKVIMVDISDTTEGPLGTTKVATIAQMSTLFDVISAQGLTAVVNNGIVYVNSGGALTSGAGLVYNGTGLSITGTQSANLFSVNASGGGDQFQISALAAGNGAVAAALNTASSDYEPFRLIGEYLQFDYRTGVGTSTEGMRLTSTGLGVGITPAAKLHAYSATNAEMRIETLSQGYLQLGQFTNGAYIGTSSSDPVAGLLRLGTAGVVRAVLDTSGNLGLGVTPSAWDSVYKAFQFSSTAGLVGASNNTFLTSNVYFASGNVATYLQSGVPAAYYRQSNTGAHIWTTAPSGTAGNAITFAAVKTIDASGHWLPGTDNTQNLGSGALRMAVLYAGTGTINTSDATEKTAVSALTASEIAAAKSLANEIGSFQFLDSVEKKGAENARHHIGMTVQRAIEVMESHGLDPFGYAFICYDEWDKETKEVVCDDGEFSREIQRQVVVETPVNYTEIEVIDGIPTMIGKTRTDRQPQVEAVAVVDEKGAPVIVDGKPLVHPVPVMETVTERYNIVTVREAGSRYGFRPDQLALFILRGMAG